MPVVCLFVCVCNNMNACCLFVCMSGPLSVESPLDFARSHQRIKAASLKLHRATGFAELYAPEVERK